MERFCKERAIRANQQGITGFLRMYLDNIPKMMFFLLPFFALLLKILYIRSRRLYIEHLIFSLHCHAFVLLLGSLALALSFEWFPAAAAIWSAVYLYIAMKAVYRQPVWKTLVKFGLLGFAYLMTLFFCLLGTLAVTLLLM